MRNGPFSLLFLTLHYFLCLSFSKNLGLQARSIHKKISFLIIYGKSMGDIRRTFVFSNFSSTGPTKKPNYSYSTILGWLDGAYKITYSFYSYVSWIFHVWYLAILFWFHAHLLTTTLTFSNSRSKFAWQFCNAIFSKFSIDFGLDRTLISLPNALFLFLKNANQKHQTSRTVVLTV